MKILVLIHEYPPIGGGGGRVAQDIARGMVRLGYSVSVLVPWMPDLRFIDFDEGVRVIRIPSFRRKMFVGDLLAMSFYLVIGFFVGLGLIIRSKPDVIHVHFAVPAGLLAWALSKITGIPYVLTSHLGDVPGGVPEKTDRWFKIAYPFTPRIWKDAAVVTAISDFTRELALKHYPLDIKVIPNSIDLRGMPSSILLKSPPMIVFVGRFVAQKNPMNIVQVLFGLIDLDWQCVMIGDGIYREEVMREIDHFGMTQRFHLPGWLSTREVEKILGGSDILFLPSRSEGLPLSGLQSLSKGLAIVASRVGSMSQLVVPGVNGFLHDPSDFEGFKASLRLLLSQPEILYRTRMASLEVAMNFDLKLTIERYEEIFIKLIKN